jgi:hypothetical protein
MNTQFIQQIRRAVSHLNPNEIRDTATRRVHVLLDASASSTYARMEDFLLPAQVSHEKRMMAIQTLTRACDASGSGQRFQLVFHERGLLTPEGWTPDMDAFAFDPARPERLVENVLEHRNELGLPLARLFPPFRDGVARRTIQTIARENALFSLMTALPNVLPNAGQLPWAVGEFASDTAILTVNQIRMAFLLAAASDRPVGYREQRTEIGSLVAGAWGWRAAARQLTSKIPFGGGLIPKAAIAYAGTYAVGLSLERLYRIGYGLTREERHEAYEAALGRGREVASQLLARIRRSPGEG